ncbi:MAG: hypothetical protein ACRERD_34920, partial [Candidatus Binatia bacterium]
MKRKGHVMREKAVLAKVFWSVAAGVVTAFSVAWFAGTVYRDGNLFAPLAALVLAVAIPFVLYKEPTKRVAFALLASALFSGLSLLALGLGGQTDGLTVFGLGVVAVAIPIGIDLVAQDFGTRLTIPPLFSGGAATVFLAAVLPLSAWMIAQQHYAAMAEDAELIRAVAQNVSPQGDSIVFDQVDPKQKDRLKKLVSVRTSAKTYRLSDAEIESVVEERTVRRESREQNQRGIVSREQAER